ncbi:MAG: efflux RND transporter periplasmic adaptor subunit [Candidatus Promineifilaceae bacterium]
MRRIIIIIVVVILIGAGAYFVIRQRQANAEGEVEILRQASVEQGSLAATVNATGSIEPEALVTLSFGLGGTVQDVNAVRGQIVSDGDILANLQTGELSLSVQQSADALRIQELLLQQALNSAPSQATLDASQADIDAAEGNLVIAQANLAAAEAAVAQAEAQKAQLLAGATFGQIAAAESQVTSARSNQRIAEEAHNRTLECFTIQLPGGGEQETCPALGPAEEQARANLENANAALAAAEAQLADLQTPARPADIQAVDAAIAAANAQLESARGNVLVAEANKARALASYDRILEGPTEDDIAILEAQVDSAQTNHQIAQLRLDQAMVIAPMNGRVANVLVNAGEQASPGAPAVNMVNEEAFHIEVSVDEIDIDQIAVGQEVDITLDALPDTIVTGTIAEIAPTAATSGVGIVTYLVTINLDSEDVTLRPGMTANASIVVEQINDVLIIPNWAIRLDRETGQSFVFKMNSDGTVEEIVVETGLRNEQFSQVLSGLKEGDVVVVTNEREGFNFFGGF